MTNKLPEVGKRYKNKKTGIETEIIRQEGVGFVYLGTYDGKRDILSWVDNNVFWDVFEELPDQEPTKENRESRTCANNAQVDKVQEALRLVKLNLKDYPISYFKEILPELREAPHFQLIEKVQNLINALEENTPALACSNHQETPSFSIVEHASKSIWKPISELPDNVDYLDIYFKHGGEIHQGVHSNGTIYPFAFNSEEQKWDTYELDYKEELKEWCLLSDFINQQESLKKRIEKLEQLIKRDNEKDN